MIVVDGRRGRTLLINSRVCVLACLSESTFQSGLSFGKFGRVH